MPLNVKTGSRSRHGFSSAHRDGDHEERGVPITEIPRHVPSARGILQQDEIPRPQPPDRPVGRLHLDRTRHEGQELPGGTRMPVANPAGLKRIEAILRCGFVRRRRRTGLREALHLRDSVRPLRYQSASHPLRPRIFCDTSPW